MPIYMIIPRYSHNYAQFCQLLNSNLSTHRRILMLLREATGETYGPRVSFSSYQSPSLYYCFAFTLLFLCFYFSHCISILKIPKILFIISIRSHFRKWSWRDWQPLSALVALSYCFCVGTRDSSVASYWIDTLILKNWGKYLRYFAASSLPLRGNPTQARDIARRISGAVAGEAHASKSTIPSTHHNPYLSHYIICHLPLVFLSPTSPLPFYLPSLFRLPFCPFAFCLLVC